MKSEVPVICGLSVSVACEIVGKRFIPDGDHGCTEKKLQTESPSMSQGHNDAFGRGYACVQVMVFL